MEKSTRNVYTQNETATQNAFNVLQHLIVNNYPFSNFQSDTQLCKNTGKDFLSRFSIDDKSKSHTSETVFIEMLEIYSETIRKYLLGDIQQSPAFRCHSQQAPCPVCPVSVKRWRKEDSFLFLDSV